MAVAIRYTGTVSGFADPLSGLTWEPRQVQPVDEGVALTLLEHFEFEDARHHKQRHKPIQGIPVPLPVIEQVTEKKERVEGIKRVYEEDDNAPPLVHLDAMTKESITMYVHRNFGVELPEKMSKAEMIDKARNFMGGAPRHY
jgi:hypothetical protein